MRFARTSLPRTEPKSLRALLLGSELDLLQADILPSFASQPTVAGLEGWDHFAGEFRHIHEALYLRPEFTLSVGIGTRSLLEWMASLAEIMVAHGSAEVPITAIRGDNVLPVLAELSDQLNLPAGKTVQSARVELGGGPFAAGFAEGGRIVLAGVHDCTAPLLGFAVSRGICEWHDYEHLAHLAAAAQFTEVVAEMRSDRSITLEPTAGEQLDEVCSQGSVSHADLQSDYRGMSLESAEHALLKPANIRSQPSTGYWNLRVVVETGWQSASLVMGSAAGLTDLLAHRPACFQEGGIECQAYRAVDQGNGSSGELLRIVYRQSSRELCHGFLDWLQLSLVRRPELVRVIAPRSEVELLTELLSFQIPAEQVMIAVDTRPASEWL